MPKILPQLRMARFLISYASLLGRPVFQPLEERGSVGVSQPLDGAGSAVVFVFLLQVALAEPRLAASSDLVLRLKRKAYIIICTTLCAD